MWKSRYWSCTKFADWIRGTDKPTSATLDEWKEWKETASVSNKFRYWLAEEGLDKLQRIAGLPSDMLYSINYYFRNRFIYKLHYLPTKLTPGKFYEVDTRILHGVFETFIDFIECDKAWMYVRFDKEARNEFPDIYKPWWKRWSSHRNPEAGIAHLKWEMQLTNTSPRQAKNAAEQLMLYNWWKNVRPARTEAYIASGFDIIENTWSREKAELHDKAEKSFRAIDEVYEQEDEEMLMRLLKTRNSLWT